MGGGPVCTQGPLLQGPHCITTLALTGVISPRTMSETTERAKLQAVALGLVGCPVVALLDPRPRTAVMRPGGRADGTGRELKTASNALLAPRPSGIDRGSEPG